MKKFVCILMALIMCLSFAACTKKASTNVDETVLYDTSKEIAVILYDNNEYDSLIKSAFEESIKKFDSSLKISVKNAEGDDEKLNSILSKITPDNTLFALSVGDDVSEAANKAFGGAVPIFFANVENPVLSGLLSDETTPLTTTGVVSRVPANYIFSNFIKSIGSSSVGHIGVIFNTSEITPMQTTNEFKRYLDLNNYYYSETVVANTLEAQQAAEKMLYKATSGSSVTGEKSSSSNGGKRYENKQDGVNMIFLSGDSVVSGSVEHIAAVLNNSDFYVYVNRPEEIRGKNFVSLMPTASSIGKNVAEMAIEYLNGTSISLIPCRTADEFDEFAYLDKNSDSADAQTDSEDLAQQN